jgi:DNA adenine methylase
MLPFLKWPGGKRWAASLISHKVHTLLGQNGTYFEPFLGGGAVFFHLPPRKSFLSDVNEELIETYKAVRDDAPAIITRLRHLPVSPEHFYTIRSAVPGSRIDRAVRMLYLNRTAFAGMYRLNAAGQFNVPFGGGERTPRILCNSPLLTEAAEVLNQIRLRCCRYEDVLSLARSGDVVYCDPTYTVTHDQNCFVRYNETNFSWADQERLVHLAEAAVKRGASVIVSNAHHKTVRNLYTGWKAITLKRVSRVSANATNRREVCEYLFIKTPN